MSDEELAEILEKLDSTCIRDFICHVNDDDCETRDCESCKKEFPILKWLQSPVDEASDMENLEARR